MSLQNIRKRVERGILGIPKKKSVLFSFNPRKGEECLSDSDDSDYFPGRRSTDDEEEASILRKAKRKVKKSPKNSKAEPVRKRPRRGESSKEEVKGLAVANGSDILQCFPPEILIKIFYHGLRLESAVKFIPRVSHVCHAWHNVATDPMLWTEIDLPFHILSLTPTKLEKLLQKDVSCCRVLNLSGQTKLSENNIETALKAMPLLASLDLSDCTNVKGSLITKLPSLCPGLKHLKLCFTKDFNYKITASAITNFLQKCGRNLVELRLARVMSVGKHSKDIFMAIEKNCPCLEILDLRMIDVVKNVLPGRRLDYDADAFFKKLPKLSELNLDGFGIVTKRAAAVGKNEGKIQLPNLQIYSHGYQCYMKPEHSLFYRMFGSTNALQHLDISESDLLPNRVVSDLTWVEELVMKEMRWRDSEHGLFKDCIDAWKLSLKRLDLSHNVLVDEAIDCAMLLYSGEGQTYPLQYLNLQATNITAFPLTCVLDKCRDLEQIDLTCCRYLPRGCKRLFVKAEFPYLHEKLKEHLDLFAEDYSSS